MICFFLSSRFFFLNTNLTKFAVIWVKGRQKEGVFGLDKLQKHTNEGKRKNKEEDRWRREKSNGRTFSFYNGYFGDVLLLDGKGPFSGNVRYINIYIFSSPENF